MALPAAMKKIKDRLEGKLNSLSADERTLLSELREVDKLVENQRLVESRSITKMTSPGDDRCSCCGREY